MPRLKGSMLYIVQNLSYDWIFLFWCMICFILSLSYSKIVRGNRIYGIYLEWIYHSHYILTWMPSIPFKIACAEYLFHTNVLQPVKSIYFTAMVKRLFWKIMFKKTIKYKNVVKEYFWIWLNEQWEHSNIVKAAQSLLPISAVTLTTRTTFKLHLNLFDFIVHLMKGWHWFIMVYGLQSEGFLKKIFEMANRGF